MLDIDRSEQVLDGEVLDSEVLDDAEPGRAELVPVAASVRWSPKPAMSQPNATFITHLIATAEQSPQTRPLYRASLADAQIAYGPHPRARLGVRTRQVI
jgi:hypothetical protein